MLRNSFLRVAVGLAATSLLAAAQDYPTIDSVNYPYPYHWSTAFLTSDSPGAKPTAVLDIFRTNQCGGGTEFASTTTINLPIDCLGASEVSTSYRSGRCPLGRSGPPLIVDTVTAWPSTGFSFTCAPTPAPSASSSQPIFTLPSSSHPILTLSTALSSHPILPTPSFSTSYILTDITRTLPLPTLQPWQTPPETPTAFSVIHHPDGTCRISLGLEQVDKRFFGTRERVEHECLEERLRPMVYKATVTETITVGCDGCQYIRGGSMTTTCQRALTDVEPGTKTVSVDGVRTRWAWGCKARS